MEFQYLLEQLQNNGLSFTLLGVMSFIFYRENKDLKLEIKELKIKYDESLKELIREYHILSRETKDIISEFINHKVNNR